MLSYIHFLLKTFSKRISSYILVAIHLIVIYIFLRVNIDNFPTNAKGISYLSSINNLMKFFPFLFASAFSILVVTHNFKESVNGVEIMIVSKPITRKQIVISKFLVVFISLLFHQVFIFIFYLLFSSYDSVASSTIRANWAISLALGGFIVQSIFVFIIVLFTSLVGKMGTAIISILIAAIIPITSIIIVPMSQGAVSLLELVSNKGVYDHALDGVQYINSLKIDSTKVINNNAGLSLSRSYDYDLGKDLKKYKLWNDYQKNKWYQDVYPFDVWYHWGRFMSMFTKDDTFADDQKFIQNLEIKDLVQLNPDDVFLKIGQKNNPDFPLFKFGLLLTLGKYSNKKITENKFQDSLQNYLKKKMNPAFKIETIQDLVANIKELFKTNDSIVGEMNIRKFNEQSFLSRLDIINSFIERCHNPLAYISDDHLEYQFSVILKVIVYKILSKEESLGTTSKGEPLRIDNSQIIITKEITHDRTISKKDLPQEKLKKLKEQLEDTGLVIIYDKNDKRNFLGYTVSSTPYASTGLVVIVWLLIGVLLGSISIAIFLKKDFK